jgi:hypothetical protein
MAQRSRNQNRGDYDYYYENLRKLRKFCRIVVRKDTGRNGLRFTGSPSNRWPAHRNGLVSV